jgi:hypothetical protein
MSLICPIHRGGASAVVAPGTVLLQDDFNDTDGTDIASHTMDVGPGWQETVGNGEIQSNRLEQIGATDPTLITADAGSRNVEVTATVNRDGDGAGIGLVLRVLDDENYWLLDYSPTVLQLFEVVAGVFTSRASVDHSNNNAVDASLKAVVRGNVFVCRVVDGVLGEIAWIRYENGTFNAEERHGVKTATAGQQAENFLCKQAPASIPAAPANAPTGLGGSYDGGTGDATLSWSDSNTDEDGFELQHRFNSGPWQIVAVSVATNVVHNSGGSPGDLLEWRVRAANQGGGGPWSSIYGISVP